MSAELLVCGRAEVVIVHEAVWRASAASAASAANAGGARLEPQPGAWA